MRSQYEAFGCYAAFQEKLQRRSSCPSELREPSLEGAAAEDDTAARLQAS